MFVSHFSASVDCSTHCFSGQHNRKKKMSKASISITLDYQHHLISPPQNALDNEDYPVSQLIKSCLLNSGRPRTADATKICSAEATNSQLNSLCNTEIQADHKQLMQNHTKICSAEATNLQLNSLCNTPMQP